MARLPLEPLSLGPLQSAGVMRYVGLAVQPLHLIDVTLTESARQELPIGFAVRTLKLGVRRVGLGHLRVSRL